MKKIYIRALALLKKKKQPLITTALLACVVVSYQNCQQSEFIEREALSAAISDEPLENIVQPPELDKDDKSLCEDGKAEDLICNPLGSGGPTPVETPSVPKSKLGLIGNIYEGQSNWNHIDRYIKDGFKHPESMYFSNFNVPTRSFSDGFGFGADDYLKNKGGEKLIEWFAIEAKGHIVLPESEEAGYYHIASISDDGIRVTVGGEDIINNPNVHAPTLDCAKQLIKLEKGEEKSFELLYFQGPRYHIALQTFIKKIDDPQHFMRSGHCSKVNSTAGLLEEGYKVISPSWFTLPTGY